MRGCPRNRQKFSLKSHQLDEQVDKHAGRLVLLNKNGTERFYEPQSEAPLTVTFDENSVARDCSYVARKEEFLRVAKE